MLTAFLCNPPNNIRITVWHAPESYILPVLLFSARLWYHGGCHGIWPSGRLLHQLWGSTSDCISVSFFVKLISPYTLIHMIIAHLALCKCAVNDLLLSLSIIHDASATFGLSAVHLLHKISICLFWWWFYLCCNRGMLVENCLLKYCMNKFDLLSFDLN